MKCAKEEEKKGSSGKCKEESVTKEGTVFKGSGSGVVHKGRLSMCWCGDPVKQEGNGCWAEKALRMLCGDVGEAPGGMSNSDDEWISVLVDCCVVVVAGCVPQVCEGGFGE